jgi:hypothetical protein
MQYTENRATNTDAKRRGSRRRKQRRSTKTREKPDNRSDKGQEGTSKPSNNSQVEKYQENRGGWNIRLLLIIVCFRASLIFIVVPSSRKTVS